MKRIFYSLVALTLTLALVSCSSDDNDLDFNEQDITSRAAILGFDDVESYKLSVAEQCALGNHENCDIFNDGTHQACAYKEHSGTKHNGSHHTGSDHGSHDSNGHSHGSHDKGHHH